jgi:hypothetical protein
LDTEGEEGGKGGGFFTDGARKREKLQENHKSNIQMIENTLKIWYA